MVTLDQNAFADLLSRFPDRDNWSLNPAVFRWLDTKWHAHSVDHFSSHYNSHVARFISQYFSPGCPTVNALARDWIVNNNLNCSPVQLVVAA